MARHGILGEGAGEVFVQLLAGAARDFLSSGIFKRRVVLLVGAKTQGPRIKDAMLCPQVHTVGLQPRQAPTQQGGEVERNIPI